MLHFLPQQLDFIRWQRKQPIHTLVNLSLRVRELTTEGIDFGLFVGKVRLPLVRDLRIGERVA